MQYLSHSHKTSILRLIPAVLFLISSLCIDKSFAADENHFLSNTRQLIYEGKRSGEGYFSADGKSLIFQSERLQNNPFFQIYMLDLESGDSRLVSTGKGKTTCSFVRPGKDEILFGSTHLDPKVEAGQKAELDFRASGKKRRYSWDYDSYMDIFSASRDGKNIKQLTTTKGYDAEAAYSPDGEKIIFCSLRNGYTADLSEKNQELLKVDPASFGEIYIMNADGSDQKRLTNSPGYDGGPFFSPDGARVIWRRFEENGMIADVYTMKIDGSNVRKITTFGCMSWAPYFHPSGKYILFASNKLGFSNFEVYMVDAAGEKEPIQITASDGFDGLPVFSPTGDKLVWTSGRTPEKNSQLFIANWSHEAALTALSEAPGRTNHAPASTSHMAAPEAVETAQVNNEKSLSPQISADDLNQMVNYIASDELEGRMTGSEGTKLAADYIVRQFKQSGLQPVGDDFLHPFEFTSGVELEDNKNSLLVSNAGKATTFTVNEDFRPLAFSADGEVEGDVIFAGYGLFIDGKPGEGYDSYSNIDVKDKIVVVLRYVPEQASMERRQVLNRYAGLRYKAMLARERGAKALLAITGPNSPNSGKLMKLGYDQSSANSGIVVGSINDKVMQTLFKASEKSLEETQSQLDLENPHFEGSFALPDVKIKISSGVKRIKKTDYNVVGMLPGSTPDAEKILIGAHYDHIGHGEVGSLAGKEGHGKIHNGADDNASGTATVLELATAFAKLKKQKPETLKRDMIFALWSGEELGIIGSARFAENPPRGLDKVAAYVNFDMVGRLRDNKLILQGTGSSSVWKKLIEKRNVVAGFDLNLQDDPFQPTDVSAFYPRGVPVLSFFTGSHEDYNKPSDDAETLNYKGMERIAKFAKLILTDLVKADEPPDYLKVEKTRSKQGNRESMRAYLGTIPDYAGDVNGVKISGVSGGGPADLAGLQGGDIIIKLAGKEITNIYDYTYAIDALKIDKEVEVVVKRGDREMVAKITPRARD